MDASASRQVTRGPTYRFATTCVQASPRHIQTMVEGARPISCKAFLRNVGRAEAEDAFPDYCWCRKAGCPNLHLRQDWAVRFYRSTFEGKPCVYVDHSAIEYVFVGQKVPVGGLR